MTRMFTVSSLALVGALALGSPGARADEPKLQPQITRTAKPPPGKRVPALRLGLSSPLGVDEAQKDGTAVAAQLTMALGHPVEAVVLPANELGKALASGKIDIGWLTAVEYVEAAKDSMNRVVPVAKALHAGLPFYRSVLFTLKKNKEILTPADLKGKKLALVSDPSSAGYVLPHQVLLAAGLTEAQIKAQTTFFKDHAGVCRAVIDGTVVAGATLSNDKAGSTIAGCVATLGARADELKVLSTSDPIPNDVFALKPGASTEQFANLRTALMDLDKSQAGKTLLSDSLHADGFTAVEDGEFDPLRAAIKGPGPQ